VSYTSRQAIHPLTCKAIQTEHNPYTPNEGYRCGCRPHPSRPHESFHLCAYHDGYDDGLNRAEAALARSLGGTMEDNPVSTLQERLTDEQVAWYAGTSRTATWTADMSPRRDSVTLAREVQELRAKLAAIDALLLTASNGPNDPEYQWLLNETYRILHPEEEQ